MSFTFYTVPYRLLYYNEMVTSISKRLDSAGFNLKKIKDKKLKDQLYLACCIPQSNKISMLSFLHVNS